ncbi:TetR/AcrR family transcriptional regulator [Trinickia symbiotica]|uniref:TetR/AcrR family transcriptional regulator n=1 Tax=Trinickia symbiotica TaxID=863227 RepID=A0A2T3XRE7_9BURK|nr:TetR/AcrR family transcriptional regulator [Trinickia symbiotica]PTB19084.1 TetR/AcrR family transcriptional regulator [Trinickia symbiotica]
MSRRQAVQGAVHGESREASEGDKAEFLAESGSTKSARASSSKLPASVRRRRSQEERRLEAEARLLVAAIELLARKGWVGMTLAEVGEAAGYSRGLATHHFGTKGEMLRALTTEMHRSFAKQMQAASPLPSGLQAVLGYVRVYFGRDDAEWTNTRALLLLLAEALLENSDTVQVVTECNRETFAWIEDNLRIGIAHGEVRSDVDPTLGAEFVVGALRGLAQQRLSQGRLGSLRRNKEQVVRLIEQAFAAPGGGVSRS